MADARIYIQDKLERIGKEQKQLAEALGVTKSAVNQWSSGATVPSAKMLPALAAALGCTVDELYHREEVRRDA